MLEASNLSVGYGKKIIVDGINFSVEQGKILALIGPNGSGKSTVLKTITKEIESLGGSVAVAGKNIFSEKEKFLSTHLAMVMTERIHPEMMTSWDVVSTGRFPYTGLLGILSDEDRKAADDAMKAARCDNISGCIFSTLSDGQKQRVMLARAICQNTEIIILDEPVTFLDMFYKLDFLKMIKKLAKEKNKVIILTLHELDLVKKISDEILCIKDGRVMGYGSPEEIFKGDFIQKLYGIKKEEFNPETGMMIWNDDSEPVKKNKVVEKIISKKRKAKVIMIQGTMSNAGKSLVVAGLCRIFRQDGYNVAPFKSQNMALNSFITKDGLEMGRAQVMQAEAAGIEPDVAMNPILLKPTSDSGSQVIVNGSSMGNMTAREYFSFKKKLVPEILMAFNELAGKNDIIVIEGAGSPAEINLRENDIVNMGLAEMVDSPVLLVGDIDRGGVFAQLFGTVQLLEKSERQRIKGLIVNKFRGDKTLLESGINFLEERCGIPVAGILPYMKISLDDEDSLTMRFENHGSKIVNIGVIKFPHISNFTDMNVFERIDDVSIHYLDNVEKIPFMDMIVLPGSKNTIGDLKWMRENGIENAIKKFSADGIVFGICGGYQMLGKAIQDPDNVEEGGSIPGMELLEGKTILQKNKIRIQSSYDSGKISGPLEFLSNKKISGYEIHMGKTKISGEENFPRGNSNKNVYGTYIHGFFDEGDIAFSICNFLARKKGCELKHEINDYKTFKETQYDLLADEMRKNLDMEAIYGILG